MSRCSEAAELLLVERGVCAAPRHELVVGALLNDLPLGDDGDLVRALDGREPMGDDDGGAAPAQLVKGALDLHLGGFFKKTLAMQRRCFCPPERVTPRSPMTVSYPSFMVRMKSWMLARFAASTTSSSVASSLP